MVTVDLAAFSEWRATWRLSTNTVRCAPNTPLSVSPGPITITVRVEATAPTWALRGTVDVPIVVLAGANITLRLTEAFAPLFLHTT